MWSLSKLFSEVIKKKPSVIKKNVAVFKNEICVLFLRYILKFH